MYLISVGDSEISADYKTITLLSFVWFAKELNETSLPAYENVLLVALKKAIND